MSGIYFSMLNAVYTGVPPTEESPMVNGFECQWFDRDVCLGVASSADVDKCEALTNVFEQAVAETILEWGKPIFCGRGDASGYEFFNRTHGEEIERVAVWRHPDCLAFIFLKSVEDGRMCGVECGTRSPQELDSTAFKIGDSINLIDRFAYWLMASVFIAIPLGVLSGVDMLINDSAMAASLVFWSRWIYGALGLVLMLGVAIIVVLAKDRQEAGQAAVVGMALVVPCFILTVVIVVSLILEVVASLAPVS